MRVPFAYLKRALLKKPEHPNSVGFLVFTLLIGCFLAAVGLSGRFGGWLLPSLWIVLGLYYAMRGIAETLPTRLHWATIVLRLIAVCLVGATFAYLAAWAVVYNV